MAVELRAHGRNCALRRGVLPREIQIHCSARGALHFRPGLELHLWCAAASGTDARTLHRSFARWPDRIRDPRSRVPQNAAPGFNSWIGDFLSDREHFFLAERTGLCEKLLRIYSGTNCRLAGVQLNADLDVFSQHNLERPVLHAAFRVVHELWATNRPGARRSFFA